MDDLRKWLENNKEARDFYEADIDGMWENIDEKLSRKQGKSGSFMWVRWAAAIAIVAVATWMLVPREEVASQGYSLHEVSPEMAETEYYYAQQLGEKMETIKASGAEIDPRLFEDLEQLDQIYKDLMLDLRDNADNEEVVQAMIENYRIRLQMLEQILGEIKKDENKNGDETNI